MIPPRPPLKSSSRRTRDLLGGKDGDKKAELTKAQERAQRVLEQAKSGARRGNIPERMSMSLIDRSGRATSASRIRRRRLAQGYDEGDEDELDKSAAEAEIGIASPLPRTLIRPIAVTIKKIHGLDGEISDFKE